MEHKTILSLANDNFRAGNYEEAIRLYNQAKLQNESLAKIVEFNIDLSKRRIKKQISPRETAQEKLFKKVASSRPAILEAIRSAIQSKKLTLEVLRRTVGADDSFRDEIYKAVYPDIEEAVRGEEFDSAYQHYEMFGKAEERIHSFNSYLKKVQVDIEVLNKKFDQFNSLFSNELWPNTAVDSKAFNVTPIPFYLNNSSNIDFASAGRKISIAVHLHLYYVDMLDEMINHLDSIPDTFDLFVSTPHSINEKDIVFLLKNNIGNLGNVVIKRVPNKGRDLGPFIIEFGKSLQFYDAVCHVHTKKSEHTSQLQAWGRDILNSLLGTKESVEKILALLKTGAKFIYPEGQDHYIKDPTGWAGNYQIAKDLLASHFELDIANFPAVEFPEGSMFWASGEAISPFLNMPLEWADFQNEPIPTDGTLAHALERIILISGGAAVGKIFKLMKNDYLDGKLFFEPQKNYQDRIKEKDIKILSFYLPQFHPIPENDEWHGKGFTEWTKVSASTPLFKGHYQQHIPHPDIGYYLLDSPVTLQKQAMLMDNAGVYGQIFYHYWFSGKLILEEPAQMLLENSSIDMPFCFCWANENWTKRWDGNESEVLLSQTYSREDARAFITYLIPFFKDPRYVKVDGRPLLYVYRPSSIPDPQEYIEVWGEICRLHGVNIPYVTAILTRGAQDPRDYGMDGALERVLHDWTDGNVKEIKDELQHFWPVNGSVIKYADVADYYVGQNEAKNFEYFRSLVPMWDNTARYGTEAHIVHDSTPEKFQYWLENSIEYTKAHLPKDRQIVVINAWNEWAEGAHLEPDTCFGYAYLNSIGRALSRISYQDIEDSCTAHKKNLVIELDIPDYIINNLCADGFLKLKFFRHLAESIKQLKSKIVVKNKAVFDELKSLRCSIVRVSDTDADITLQFRKIALVGETCLAAMESAHLRFPGAVIIANEYGKAQKLQEYKGHDSVAPESAYDNSLILIPKERTSKSFKIAHRARTFVTQPSVVNSPYEVTTIIRFHKNDRFNELKNSLLSLAAVHSCIVRPIICAQDLSADQFKALSEICSSFDYKSYSKVEVIKFFSKNKAGDIRSKLLFDGLHAAKTEYVAFLDHDDLMLTDSYSYLIGRMVKTGKAVSFGRVYDTTYESNTEKLLKRSKTYEYGYSYEEFLEVNHAPLHSFLINKNKIDLSSLAHFEDQKFMEDYYMTLQMFGRDNTDWASLRENFYVGDYVHCIDRTHTLAISDDKSRNAVLKNSEYEKCEQRVLDLKKRITSRNL